MAHPTINDLPNELLELIFDQLDMDYLKDASLVCRRWSDLTFSGRRMDRVKLVANFPWDKHLLQSNRQYSHLELGETEKCFAHLKELFNTFNVSSLRIEDRDLSYSSLRLILLEAPNLQHLSIVCEPDLMNEMIDPLPVMRNLERLEIDCSILGRTFPLHMIAPSLKGLKMYCNDENQLEQWRRFSGQLKQACATCDGQNLLHRFCEMTFPLLEELSIIVEQPFNISPDQQSDFCRRNSSLRLLRLDGFYISKTLVEDITHHCKKLSSLAIQQNFYNSVPGLLESLSQLTELKHLIMGNVLTFILHGCEAFTSLQSLCIRDASFGGEGLLSFIEDLFKIAPQLRCLELGSVVITESVAQFICNNFSNLTRLQLSYSAEVSRDFFSGIDRLPRLWYLELKLFNINGLSISVNPQNKVRYLTMHLPIQYCQLDLLRLLECFPQLDRLNLIIQGQSVDESTVDKLCKILPTCAIKLYAYPLTDAEKKRRFQKWARSEMMPWEKEWKFYYRI
ncbi:uncharacterized protein LOC128266905 [Anopheles cruzii]|uniref:uncharacterized protein LOC128266905 n=1 Tax=Anopheles cruzii TaxID=68878 RepID=UPI0022EC65E5|nr:uncharacterized protein LOC128266905 [Anopheles cruzii]